MTDDDYGYDLGTYSLPVHTASPEAQRCLQRASWLSSRDDLDDLAARQR